MDIGLNRYYPMEHDSVVVTPFREFGKVFARLELVSRVRYPPSP